MGVTLKKLEVNFAAGVAPQPWAGRVLAVAALALLADAGLSYYQARTAIDAHQAAIARAEPRAAPARKVPAEELAVVRDTVERLALPWERLFQALEAAASGEVTLAGIEPDPKAGTVIISGQGRDYPAALEYVQRLERSEALSRVQLVRHEARHDRGAVTFAVSATWNGGQK
ncbi:MAG TPA: PilN domain-containing protein [Burkholderiales bacterium]|nr:PilN domain-containing protein [Burkholderiales bacterium]